ncbi:MAG TPA: UDP-glucose 4-epimerase GalE [Chitinophagales bacterium]|nr:UDP-glucose 4-epimerase GalE [Chitinophagales bacterium]
MAKLKVIVTGGGGYIGSHTIVDLIQNGFEVISIDNFSHSSEKVFEGIQEITGQRVFNYNIDLKDRASTLKVLGEHVDAVGVIHFAAYKSVPESVEKPLKYYKNNMEGLFNIVEGVEKYKIPHFVFSSSCSVYGLVDDLPLRETTPFGVAQCAYARTKQHGEQMLEDVSLVANFNTVLLRYFNPVGAHPSAKIAEMPIDAPNNLVPIVTQVAIGKREILTVFGGDYPTRDGSCVRDYIHVCDVAHAHTLAMQYLYQRKAKQKVEVFNLGTGDGVTVLEVIQAFEKTTGEKLRYEIGSRRLGDVVKVYADNSKAKSELGWELKYSLKDMMQSAWDWEQKMLKL